MGASKKAPKGYSTKCFVYLTIKIPNVVLKELFLTLYSMDEVNKSLGSSGGFSMSPFPTMKYMSSLLTITAFENTDLKSISSISPYPSGSSFRLFIILLVLSR